MFKNARIVGRLFEQRTDGWAEAEMLDAGFDGGEWSGPAWDEQWCDTLDDVIQFVADRTGHSFAFIHDEWNEYIHQYPYCLFNS